MACVIVWSISSFCQNTFNIPNTAYGGNPVADIPVADDSNKTIHYYNLITPWIDSAAGKIYLPNGGQSNISVIDFDHADFLRLENNSEYLTWLSFPRLDREGNNPVSVNEALLDKVNPQYSDESNLKYYNIGNNYYSEYINENWDGSQGLLENVKTSNGYILDLEYSPFGVNTPIWLHLRGSRLEPGGAQILLDDQYETWAGYWLTEPQHPMQAIPAGALIHLYQIEGQYWSCHKHYDEGLPYWLCACSKGDGMIHYGDMVKLYVSSLDFIPPTTT
ncbi:MAG: hypothetical protein R6T99_08325 [Bacteroidales bacterium]